jgi:hypothetical protein
MMKIVDYRFFEKLSTKRTLIFDFNFSQWWCSNIMNYFDDLLFKNPTSSNFQVLWEFWTSTQKVDLPYELKEINCWEATIVFIYNQHLSVCWSYYLQECVYIYYEHKQHFQLMNSFNLHHFSGKILKTKSGCFKCLLLVSKEWNANRSEHYVFQNTHPSCRHKYTR